MKKNAVTFSAMTCVSNIPGDDGEQFILLDGKRIGTIHRHMEDVSVGMSREWQVGEYEVEFFDLPRPTPKDDELDRVFTVNRRGGDGYPTARKALAAAKRYARDIVAGRLA